MKHALAFGLFAVFLLSGCADPSGAGSASINQRVVAYGIGAEGVTFVIFTDIPAPNTKTRSEGKSEVSASGQAGSIQPPSGPRVDYTSDSVRLKIGGQEYPLAKGRVFLAATRDGRLEIQQLDVPIRPTDLSSEALRAEIRRLAEDEKVHTFMTSAAP